MPGRRLLLSAVIGALVLPACARPTPPATRPGVQTELEMQRRAVREAAGRYLLFLPEGYDGRERWPMILFLHGAGERGDDLERVRVHGPPRLVERSPADYPFIVVSPQVPEDRIWSTRFLDLLLDEVVPPSRSDELFERLRRCGGHVRYTRYDDAEHDAWTRTYEGPELYRWFLQHRRGEAGPWDPAVEDGS
jgi:predicted peptidase